jgi:hypothetical protein
MENRATYKDSEPGLMLSGKVVFTIFEMAHSEG